MIPITVRHIQNTTTTILNIYVNIGSMVIWMAFNNIYVE